MKVFFLWVEHLLLRLTEHSRSFTAITEPLQSHQIRTSHVTLVKSLLKKHYLVPQQWPFPFVVLISRLIEPAQYLRHDGTDTQQSVSPTPTLLLFLVSNNMRLKCGINLKLPLFSCPVFDAVWAFKHMLFRVSFLGLENQSLVLAHVKYSSGGHGVYLEVAWCEKQQRLNEIFCRARDKSANVLFELRVYK